MNIDFSGEENLQTNFQQKTKPELNNFFIILVGSFFSFLFEKDNYSKHGDKFLECLLNILNNNSFQTVQSPEQQKDQQGKGVKVNCRFKEDI